MNIPHFGWGSGLASSMPKDTFYIVNKLEPGERRGSDLCVSNGIWTWVRSIKPKPNNVILTGKSWSEIDPDDYDVVIIIADAGQMNLLKYVNKMPRVFKFHLKNPGTKDCKEQLLKEIDGYPLIFSAESQKEWYGTKEGYVITGGKDPNLYSGWIGNHKKVHWTCERISHKGTVRWEERGGKLWDQVAPYLPSIRYGLDFELGTTLVPFEELLFALKHNRVYFEAATNTLLTDGLMEAMMVGMPVIVYPANEMDRVIQNEVNGFKSKDPKKIIEYAKRLLADYDLAKEYGKKARETALKVWNPFKTERLHHKVFNKAIKIFNQKNKTNRIPTTELVFPTRTDLFFEEVLTKRLKELEREAKAEIGWFRCPLCAQKFKIHHSCGEHDFKKVTEIKRREKPIIMIKPRFFEILKDLEKIGAGKQEIKLLDSNKPCPNCQNTKIKEESGNLLVCGRCKKILGKWRKTRDGIEYYYDLNEKSQEWRELFVKFVKELKMKGISGEEYQEKIKQWIRKHKDE